MAKGPMTTAAETLKKAVASLFPSLNLEVSSHKSTPPAPTPSKLSRVLAHPVAAGVGAVAGAVVGSVVAEKISTGNARTLPNSPKKF